MRQGLATARVAQRELAGHAPISDKYAAEVNHAQVVVHLSNGVICVDLSQRQARILRVFVATPRDTVAERAVLANAVDSVNRLTGRQESFRIELVHWSTDTYPAIGDDTQSVINAQIGDYDLLLVILNKEFGSRTPRANSGTEEEYDRAVLRYRRNPISVQILVYFSNPSVRLHDIDPYSLLQIKSFRSRLEKEGVRYQMYGDLPEFERLVSTQLAQATRDFLANIEPASPRNRAGGQRETIHLPEWRAFSRPALPQGANYFEVDLLSCKRDSVVFEGKFNSSSDYFRFGFKIGGFRQPIFSDGSIQTSDPNIVFHIGKNKSNEAIFFTVYRNGRRIGVDHIILGTVAHESHIEIGFSLDSDNVIEFIVMGEVIHEDRLPIDARERLVVLLWADENQCEGRFYDVSLTVSNTRAKV